MTEIGILNNLKIDQIHKYILYISGVILILSIFAPTNQIDVRVIRKDSFIFLIVGIVLWITFYILDLIDRYYTRKYEMQEIEDFELNEIQNNLGIAWITALILSIIVGLMIIFIL